MKIKGFDFIKTCESSPEQYDVKDREGNQVAYVRLRFGLLYCDVPDVGGVRIYEFEDFESGMQGIFENEEQRQYHLNKIAEELEKR